MQLERAGRFSASAVNGAAYRTRTCDPIITNDVLYQLSYTGAETLLWPY